MPPGRQQATLIPTRSARAQWKLPKVHSAKLSLLCLDGEEVVGSNNNPDSACFSS